MPTKKFIEKSKFRRQKTAPTVEFAVVCNFGTSGIFFAASVHPVAPKSSRCSIPLAKKFGAGNAGGETGGMLVILRRILIFRDRFFRNFSNFSRKSQNSTSKIDRKKIAVFATSVFRTKTRTSVFRTGTARKCGFPRPASAPKIASIAHEPTDRNCVLSAPTAKIAST